MLIFNTVKLRTFGNTVGHILLVIASLKWNRCTLYFNADDHVHRFFPIDRSCMPRDHSGSELMGSLTVQSILNLIGRLLASGPGSSSILTYSEAIARDSVKIVTIK